LKIVKLITLFSYIFLSSKRGAFIRLLFYYSQADICNLQCLLAGIGYLIRLKTDKLVLIPGTP